MAFVLESFDLYWELVFLLSLIWLMVRFKVSFFRIMSAAVDYFRRFPETIAFGVFSIILFIRAANFPISLWDGRSIWLFHSKQIYFNGMLDLMDLRNPEYSWSHMVYPLLFPSWPAFFSGLSSTFNERMASLGIPVLWSALLSVSWTLSRSTIGRWPAAALTLAAILSTDHFTSGGYADPYIVVLIGLEYLAFTRPSTEVLGYFAALLASLIKLEGLLYSSLVLSLFVLFHPLWRNRSPSKRILPYAFMIPSLMHRLWLHGNGVIDPQEQISFPDVVYTIIPRLSSMLEEIPRLIKFEATSSYHAGNPWIALGLLFFILAIIAFLILRNLKAMPTSTAHNINIGLASCFTFILMGLLIPTVLRDDPKWLVQVTLNRLYLHPALLMLLCPFLLIQERTVMHDPQP